MRLTCRHTFTCAPSALRLRRVFSDANKTSHTREVHANSANKHRTLIVMAKTSRLFNATLSAALVTDVDMKSFRRAKTMTHYANNSNRHSWACDATRAADGRKDLSVRCPLVSREVFTKFAKVVTELFMLCGRDAITVLFRPADN